MKREQLKELGLSDESIDKIMSLHGQTVTDLNTRLNAAENERDSVKQQLETNQSELEKLKESATDNEELTNQLNDLQNKMKESETQAQEKLVQQEKDFAIKLALKEANALDEEIVLGQIDKDTVKVVDGKLQGFSEQLESLKENKAFLFQKAEEKEKPNPTPAIVAGGNPSGSVPEGGSILQKIQERLGD
ncbi:phage scaffolding protein [Listeria kieliensis]|uniref:phage scaffolding protein n=1 Tax=Listeria aquatica TaxID=1494960 RepID=UPI003EF31F59